MMIRNNDELKLFEETLNRCRNSVLVLTAQGEQYDLKDPAERYPGITEILRGNENEEPELFATSPEDEMQLFRFLETLEKRIA